MLRGGWHRNRSSIPDGEHRFFPNLQRFWTDFRVHTASYHLSTVGSLRVDKAARA